MNIEELEKHALNARRNLFKALGKLGSGHYGACLSEIEVLTYLYFEEMKIKPEDPTWDGRDFFVLSKGHGGFGLYSVLAERGFFSSDRLEAYENGVMLPKHANKHRIPGVEISTGSLGQGLSAACGIALALKNDGSSAKVFALLGDGECDEGQIWEAAMFASKYNLSNLIIAIDMNSLQFDGPTEEVMPLQPFSEKWKSFGWHAVEADGHDFNSIRAAYAVLKWNMNMPKVVILHTTKGKGISFMENQVAWHGGSCSEEQILIGYKDLGMDF